MDICRRLSDTRLKSGEYVIKTECGKRIADGFTNSDFQVTCKECLKKRVEKLENQIAVMLKKIGA